MLQTLSVMKQIQFSTTGQNNVIIQCQDLFDSGSQTDNVTVFQTPAKQASRMQPKPQAQQT